LRAKKEPGKSSLGQEEDPGLLRVDGLAHYDVCIVPSLGSALVSKPMDSETLVLLKTVTELSEKGSTGFCGGRELPVIPSYSVRTSMPALSSKLIARPSWQP
jgi:hypothetical protein